MIIDEAFEDKVLACILRQNEFCVVASQHLKPSYFESTVKYNLAKLGLDFFARYGVHLTDHAYVEKIRDLVKSKVIKEDEIGIYVKAYKHAKGLDISDAPYILDELIQFIKNREWKAFIETTVKKHLPKGNYTEIEKMALKISAIDTLADPEPYDYFDPDVIDERAERRAEEALVKRVGISTGIKKMDDTLHRCGWFGKEIYVIMAPPKRGKTMSLLWFANTCAWQGFNAAYFSCEVAADILADRADAMNTGVETRHLPTHLRDVAKRLKERRPEGKLLFYEYPPNTLTPSAIERQLDKLERQRGIETSALFVDYGDILKPERHTGDRLQEEASIFRDLRAIGVKRNIPVVTATQVNRMGSDKALITGRDVRGTWDKIADADEIITLSATEEELKKGELRIHFSESRNSERRTFKIATSYNLGKFYKEFLEEED